MKKQNLKDITTFIKEAIEDFNNGETGVYRYILDEDLCLYIGWEYGFDEDNGHDGYEICGKIAYRNDYYWCDMDCLDMPCYPNSEETWDTDVALSNEYENEARYFISEYEEIRKAV